MACESSMSEAGHRKVVCIAKAGLLESFGKNREHLLDGPVFCCDAYAQEFETCCQLLLIVGGEHSCYTETALIRKEETII